MSKKRIRRPTEIYFPYGKSIVASCVLIVVFMLVLAIVADSRSGEIRSPALVWFVLTVLPIGIAVIFYSEYRLQKEGFVDPPAIAESSKPNQPDGTEEFPVEKC